jgi:hypothetical protein
MGNYLGSLRCHGCVSCKELRICSCMWLLLGIRKLQTPCSYFFFDGGGPLDYGPRASCYGLNQEEVGGFGVCGCVGVWTVWWSEGVVRYMQMGGWMDGWMDYVDE